jgi:hypothetical protein
MDDVPIISRVDEGQLFKRVLAYYSVPAYVRRAREVEDAFDELIAKCARQRDEWLKKVRSRLSCLCAVADDRLAQPSHFADLNQLEVVRRLAASLNIESSQSPGQKSTRAFRRQLQELWEDIERYNRRWSVYVNNLDLTRVNRLRDEYNRYYLLEKECAMRSARLARQGFRRLSPLMQDDLLSRFPLLELPAPRV